MQVKTIREKLSDVVIREKLMKRAQKLVSEVGPITLISGFLKGDSEGHVAWSAMDICIMSILIVAPVPGATILAGIYYRSLKHNGLSSDSGSWVTVGSPVLILGKDDAEGSIDQTPLLYITSPDVGVPSNKAIDDLQGWIEKSKTFLIQDHQVELELGKVHPELKTPLAQATYDAYREIPEMDPHKFAMGEALNQITRLPTDKVFTANYVGDFTEPPKNSRGNTKKMATVSRLGTSNGLHYRADDATQVLNTAATRYAVQQKAYVLDEEGRRLARQIADHCFDEIIDEKKLALAWNDISGSDVYNGWLQKSRSAGYSASHSLLAEEDDRILRFQGKGNFKAKEDLVSLDSSAKAPQGILAWSKGANSFFGFACRMVSDVIRNSLKDEVVWNNGMTVEQAAERFVKASLNVPTPENVRLDAVEMDSKQNEFTHFINRSFIEKMLVSCEFLDLYFSMLEDYHVVNPEMKMHLKWVKPSGEPWTLLGNSFLMTALCLWLIKGDGPMALFTQGDDVDRNQANMRIDPDRLENLALYCGFDMTMEWGDFAAFCGFVLKDGQLVPNIRRKLIKLSGCSYRSQKHFEEVQIGMRDWVKALKNHIGFADIIKANAETYNVPYSTAEAWFEAIDSLSHISADQFRSAANRVQLNTKYLTANGMLESVY